MNENDALQNQISSDLHEIEETQEAAQEPKAEPHDSPNRSADLPVDSTDGQDSACTEQAESDGERADEGAADDLLSSADAQNSDPDPEPVGEDPAMARMEALETELANLKAELARRNEESEKIERECSEFYELYPDVPLGSLPDGVWDAVKNGVPIAAAYALSERKRLLRQQKAEQSNRENQKRSTGSLSGTDNSFFSPTEVRAMSPTEVRANYKKIMMSMQKWH